MSFRPALILAAVLAASVLTKFKGAVLPSW
jgi:hypothetical protein